MIRDTFIPGQWLDAIDVNDFINLNRKPFLEYPTFLKNPSLPLPWNTLSASAPLTYQLSYSSWQDSKLEWLHNQPLSYTQVKIGRGESLHVMKGHTHITPGRIGPSDTSISELIRAVSVSDIRKMQDYLLLTNDGAHHTPSAWFPDVRMIPLYGTKFIIKEKRLQKQLSDMRFQSTNWVDERLALDKSIRSLKQLEKLAKRHNLDVTRPATNSYDMLQILFISILAIFLENPSVPFSLHDITTFMDIYFSSELEEGQTDEETVQGWVDTFWFRISMLRFSVSPHLSNTHGGILFPLGETIDTRFLTRTTYRFLHTVERFQLYSIPLRVLWYENVPPCFWNTLKRLLPFTSVTFGYGPLLPIQAHASLQPFSLIQENGNEICFESGTLNAAEVLFLALNGGKDRKGAFSLFPATQPHRSPTLSYEDALERWRHMMIHICTLWVEHTNSVSYLTYTRNTHPFRASLYTRLTDISMWFSFSHLKPLASMLSSLYQGTAQVTMNSQGWVTDISQGEIVEEVMEQLCRIIEEELTKLPLYRTGTARIRFWEDNPYTPISPSVTFPTAMPYGLGCVTVSQVDLDSLLSYFEQGYALIHVSNSMYRNAGGCTVVTPKA